VKECVGNGRKGWRCGVRGEEGAGEGGGKASGSRVPWCARLAVKGDWGDSNVAKVTLVRPSDSVGRGAGGQVE
jgi:hypothetical protein